MKELSIGNGKIYEGDCNTIMPTLKEESVDLIVTSPPYNLEKEYVIHNDAMPYQEYLSFLEQTWQNCYRLLKWDGRICINLGNVSVKTREFTVAHVAFQLKKIGFNYRDHAIWNKQNIHKRTAWGSWKSPSCPYLIQPFEYILVFNKKFGKKRGTQTDLTREEFIDWTNALWSFQPETKVKEHPAPFPMELPKRLIKLYSFIGDTIFDPFLGSGTTGLVAEQLKRRWIGIEINPSFVELAKQRITRELKK